MNLSPWLEALRRPMSKQKLAKVTGRPNKSRALCPPKNTPEKDLVMTPPALAREIVDYFVGGGSCLDPARGQKAFYRALKRHSSRVHWCELAEGKDFLTYDPKRDHIDRFDWVVTNPPWSMFAEFLFKAFSMANNVVFLATLTHFTTKARLREIRLAGWRLQTVYIVDTPKSWPQGGFQVVAGHLVPLENRDGVYDDEWNVDFVFSPNIDRKAGRRMNKDD